MANELAKMWLFQRKVETMRLVEIKADRILHNILATFDADQRHVAIILQVGVVEDNLCNALDYQFTLYRKVFFFVLYNL